VQLLGVACRSLHQQFQLCFHPSHHIKAHRNLGQLTQSSSTLNGAPFFKYTGAQEFSDHGRNATSTVARAARLSSPCGHPIIGQNHGSSAQVTLHCERRFYRYKCTYGITSFLTHLLCSSVRPDRPYAQNLRLTSLLKRLCSIRRNCQKSCLFAGLSEETKKTNKKTTCPNGPRWMKTFFQQKTKDFLREVYCSLTPSLLRLTRPRTPRGSTET
jgi:hypothetical protein